MTLEEFKSLKKGDRIKSGCPCSSCQRGVFEVIRHCAGGIEAKDSRGFVLFFNAVMAHSVTLMKSTKKVTLKELLT